jgi:ribosome maturation factor RimP
MSGASAGQKLATLLAPVVDETGLDLEAVLVTSQGRRTEVRVLVDKDGGITLDDVAQVSQAVSAVLDQPAADAILGATPYVLEVSSPGVDRPLTEPRHWRRALGRLVRVTAAGEVVTGRITDVHESGVQLAVVGAKPQAEPEPRSFAFAELGPGRVQVEFNRERAGDASEESA